MREGNITNAKRIYFVRHGETNSNANQIVQGLDDVLSDRGIRQAATVATRAMNISFDRLIASDAVRTQETAKAIASATGKKIELSEIFREVRRPSIFIGTSRESEEVQAFLKEEREHMGDPGYRHSDEETFSDVLARVKEAVSFLENTPEQSVLVVTHGHFLRCVIGYLLMKKDLTPDGWLKLSHTLLTSNIGVTVALYTDDVWQLLTWNDHAHFAE